MNTEQYWPSYACLNNKDGTYVDGLADTSMFHLQCRCYYPHYNCSFTVVATRPVCLHVKMEYKYYSVFPKISAVIAKYV